MPDDQVTGWNEYYKRGRLAYMPELFVVRFFRALRNRGGFLSEHHVADWPCSSAPAILDFGCGNGRHLVFLHQEGWDVAGCDVSAEAVELARQSLASDRGAPRVDVLTDRLPYSTGTFDIVLSHGVFDHIPVAERQAWQREVARVLKPRGLLYASFITDSLHETGAQPGEQILQDGDEAGLTQTFYTADSVLEEYGRLFAPRSIAYDDRGLVFPERAIIEHRLWAFLEKKSVA